MRISNSALEAILREYDEKQLSVQREFRERTQRLQEEIPELTDIDSRISQLSVDMAVRRIKGENVDLKQAKKEIENLSDRKRALLHISGYDDAALEPHYGCELCKDTGYVGQEMCRCLKKRIIEVLYDQSNIRSVLTRENFMHYNPECYDKFPDADNPEIIPYDAAGLAFEEAKRFIADFHDSKQNLLFTGGVGTGKTYLSNCIAKELLDQGYAVLYFTAVQLFSILSKVAFGRDPLTAEQKESLISCDLLIIDDLGTEYSNNFVQSAFFDCINERILRGKHTLITTNLTLEAIRTNYSDRTLSRIWANYDEVKFYGKDIRIKKKLGGIVC